MWRQCGEGDFTLVTSTLAQEYARHEVISRSQGIDNGDAIDSDDDDDMAEHNDALISEAMTDEAIVSGGSLAPAEVPEEVPVLVDEDGFQTVFRGKRGGRKPG